MACIFKCDGCGKELNGENYNGQWYKPTTWFERSDEDGTQTACCRECIKKISEKTGKTSTILPI